MFAQHPDAHALRSRLAALWGWYRYKRFLVSWRLMPRELREIPIDVSKEANELLVQYKQRTRLDVH